MMDPEDEKQISEYVTVIADALREKCGPKILVVDAFLACITMACEFVAMIDQPRRGDLCEVVENNFRSDVEIMAADPATKAGVQRLQ